ncbi:uncharacterized protein LOC132784864 [Drosophila nasuta]|uniref:uncharacterized protein LOC132784864 n=1 Tax=Drosophila nasuta TaxID=42062 RepID=UPI00295E40C9|nr:uncharacterized protein LOC132784864 [Drosophila nasuta]
MACALYCLALLLLTVILVAAEEDAKITLLKFEKVMEDDVDFESHVEMIKQDDGTAIINGEFKQHVSLDNDWKINITLYHAHKPDEEYKKSPERLHTGVCEFMSTYYKRFFYEKLKNYSNAPHPDTCPLPPEHYHLKDYPYETPKIKKMMRNGYYRMFGRLQKEDHVKIEYLVEFLVE